MSKLTEGFNNLGYDILGLKNVFYSDFLTQADTCVDGYGCGWCTTCTVSSS